MNNYHGHNLSEYAFKENSEIRLLSYLGLYDKNQSSKIVYFKWKKNCDKFYQPNMDFDEVFPLSKPIQYQTSLNIVGTRRVYHDGTRIVNIYFDSIKKAKKIDFITEVPPSETITHEHKISPLKYTEIPLRESSGFMTPKYTFIDFRHPNQRHLAEAGYNDALNLFNIKENTKISVSKYAEIGSYRNILFSQMKRQANEIQNINRELANVLKVYYFEFERAIVLEKSNEQSMDKIKKFDNLWSYIKDILRYLYVNNIQCGVSLQQLERDSKYSNKERIETRMDIAQGSQKHVQLSDVFLLYDNKYIEKELLDSIYSGFRDLMKAKEPILETAFLIVSKILPLESMLEDFLLNHEIKSTEEFGKNLKTEPTIDEIIEYTFALKTNGMKWEVVMDEIREWLLKEHGFDEKSVKSKYRFSMTDPDTFQRVMRKIKKRIQNRNI